MAPKISCPICAFDRTASHFVSCPSCSSDVCYECVANFVKNLAGDVACMSCKHPWDRTFIFRSLPPSLVHSTIKAQREEVLFEREKALLPATMPLIPLADQATILKQEKDQVAKQIKDLEQRLHEVNRRIHENSRQQFLVKRNIEGRPVNVGAGAADASTRKEKKPEPENEMLSIVCHCPNGDCRGYVMKKDHKCGLCSSKICKKCHVVVASDEEHTCNPDNVASVKLIKSECKACPGCGVPSRKTEGCSQVWCIVCKKAWDWNTMKIDTGSIHATDYFNYMRSNNINIPAGPVAQGNYGCQNQHPALHLPRLTEGYPTLVTKEVDAYVRKRYQVVQEYLYVRRNIVPADNLDLRIDYLRKKIDEKHWKSTLHKRDKKYAFDTEIHRIRAAYSAIMNDAINTFCRAQQAQQVRTALENMYTIDKLMQDEYQKLAKAFVSKKKCPFA